MSFGKRLAEVRKEKNMSQDDLSKALQIAKTTIGRYERDEVKPSIEVALKIARTLGVSLDYLTGNLVHALNDSKVMEDFNELLSLKEEDRKRITLTLEALIRDAKAKSAYGS